VICINICFICHTVKQKKKRKKGKGPFPSAWAPGTRGRANKKNATGLPRVPKHLALWEGKIKKRQSLPRVPWQLALREEFSKKTNFFP
jgi:hypothetical protein